MKRLVRIEIIGAAFMVALGSVLHFAFEWSGGWRPLALVAAVNESVWEHLKLVFWPGVIWGVCMPLHGHVRRRDVFAVKGITLFFSAAMIVLVFVSYTAVLGDNLLAVDIATFVLAVLTGQLLSAWLLHGKLRRGVHVLGLALLAVQLVAYSSFTYHPPDHWLFIEASSQQRGIP